MGNELFIITAGKVRFAARPTQPGLVHFYNSDFLSYSTQRHAIQPHQTSATIALVLTFFFGITVNELYYYCYFTEQPITQVTLC